MSEVAKFQNTGSLIEMTEIEIVPERTAKPGDLVRERGILV